MATIKDVALAAGVSIATVSHYINKSKPVGRQKADRIAEAIAGLGYVPNQMARNLRRPGGNHIGVILPNMQDQYYVQILEGIEQYFTAHNYFVSLGVSGESPEQEKKYISHFMELQAAGIICISCMPKGGDFFTRVTEKSGLPFVCLDRRIEGIEAPLLCFDNRKTMKGLAQTMLNEGRKKFVLVCGPASYSCESEAEAGFLEALEQAGDASCEVLHTALNKEAAFRAMLLYLQRARPDAVLATSKPVAAGILESLTVVGLSATCDVTVGTLGEDNWNRQHERPDVLYTARQAITMGKEAGKVLLKKIKHPNEAAEDVVLEDVWRLHSEKYNSLPQSSSSHKAAPLRLLMVDNQQVELFSGLIPHFTNHTGIETEIIRVEEQSLLAQIKAPAQNADVLMFDMPWLYTLADSGILADISPYMQDFDENIYLHNCLDYYGKFRGAYYGLPYTYAPQILFYRRDVFDSPMLKKQYFSLYHEELRPPKSWSEFNRVALFFDKDKNSASLVKHGTLLPTAYKECLLPEVYMRMRAYGGEVYNSRFQVNFGTSQTVKALSSLAALFDQSKPFCQGVTDRDAAEAFLRGETAMQITYPSYLSDAADIHRGLQIGTTGYAPVPGKCPILGGWSLGVSAKSHQKEAAFAFIKWACGEYMANYSAILAGQSAIRSSFENNELISLYPWLPLYRDTYLSAEPILPPHKPGREIIPQEKVDDIIAKGVYRLLNEDITPQLVAGEIQESLTALFREYRY